MTEGGEFELLLAGKLFVRRHHGDDRDQNDGRGQGHGKNRCHPFDANTLARVITSFDDGRVFNHVRLLYAGRAISPFLVGRTGKIERAIWSIGQFFIG